MGKKRPKQRSPQGSTADDDLSGATCTHIRKAIDHSLLKKAGLNKHWNTCQGCEQDKNSASDAQPENEAELDASAVWMCLKCGHRGCGRYSENQHAVKHYDTPRSETHCLVLSLDNWSVWCYVCDDNVHYSRTGQLAQLVSNIRKQALADSNHKTLDNKCPSEELKEECNVTEDVPEEKDEKKEKGRKGDKQNGVIKGSTVGSAAGTGGVPVRGLSNMGNTCFFNAVLQNLSQTQLLRDLLRDVRDEETRLSLTPPSSSQLDPLDVQLRKPGSLTLAMCHLLNEIENTQKSVVTPRELFTQVCKKSPRFKGYQQQDSHELLRILLDGIKTEESIRVSAGIVEALKSSEKKSDEEQVKGYERSSAARTAVDRVFGGELTNTLMCKECKTVTLVKEPFLDLCLPVAEESYRKKNMKKVIQQRKNSSGSGGPDSPTPLTNGNEDMPTGAGSKYQQKKAKKQARKQAKNQKRQQKLESRLTLESLTNQVADSPDAPPVSTNGQDEDGVKDETQQPARQSENAVILDEDCKKPAEEEEEEEEDESTDATNQAAAMDANNRFNALLEEGTGADASMEQDEGEEEDDKEADEVTDELAESISALKLQPSSEDIHKQTLGGGATAGGVEYTVVNQDPDLAFRSLASRAAPDKQECSVESCFHHYTDTELLNDNNCLLCVTCTNQQNSSTAPNGSKKNVYRETLKQTLISSTPPVLSLQMKRFQQVGYSMTKVTRHVQFPQVLDIAPYCSYNCKGVREGETKVLYSLYGIVEHSGTMRSGHYEAYVKVRSQTDATLPDDSTTPGETAAPKGSWFQISDSSVKPVREAEVHNSQAYLLFYERIY